VNSVIVPAAGGSVGAPGCALSFPPKSHLIFRTAVQAFLLQYDRYSCPSTLPRSHLNDHASGASTTPRAGPTLRDVLDGPLEGPLRAPLAHDKLACLSGLNGRHGRVVGQSLCVAKGWAE
jgi:hypothetical protein